MHTFPFLSLALLGVALTAQSQVGPTATSQDAAAARWMQLRRDHAARMEPLQRGDAAGRAKVMLARMDDLEAYAREFAGLGAANEALVEVVRMGAAEAQFAERGKAVLPRIDPRIGDIGPIGTAVIAARKLGVESEASRLLDGAASRPALVDRMELVQVLRQSVRDEARAAKVLADTEAQATTDDAKADFRLAKANLLRRLDPRDRTGYAAALTSAAAFPETKSGKLAAAKLAALNLTVGSLALPFTVKDMEGKDVALADYRGKVLLLEFWASWCSPCLAEMPALANAQRRFQSKGFEILSVSVDRAVDRAKVEAAIKEHAMAWRHVFDGAQWNSELAQLYDVTSVPFSLLIGKDGKVVAKGLRGPDLADAVEKALQQP